MRAATRLALFSVALALCGTARLHAQCGSVVFGCTQDPSGHEFDLGSEAIGTTHPCMFCQFDGQNTDAYVCHPTCDVSMAPSEKKSYLALVVAARNGDVDQILKLAPKLPAYASYNRARSAVQIQGCDKREVVATLKLRTAAQIEVASSLPSRDIKPEWLTIAAGHNH